MMTSSLLQDGEAVSPATTPSMTPHSKRQLAMATETDAPDMGLYNDPKTGEVTLWMIVDEALITPGAIRYLNGERDRIKEQSMPLNVREDLRDRVVQAYWKDPKLAAQEMQRISNMDVAEVVA